ncbi:gluconate 2-dehydrogenase subunit 3 family protein [Vibrio zhugei]|uniref:Gluconate 2-dehydrogenase subunit 3 family protein n=1 Tax=Vibrio zhugei TaxID=2479546 RepID=A0ABV7CAF3_9VIBR|nr:gluconate 2-dehydrogenase subunit 3 family protein [Vibrio zhugei]
MEESTDKARRKFLKSTLIVGSASVLGPTLIFPAFADPMTPINLQDYQPIFFNSDEWSFILTAVDQLIPADEYGPSAIETHVPIFIDRQMQGNFGKAADWYMEPPFAPHSPPELGYQSPLTPADTYRHGIKATNQYCVKTFGTVFSKLPAQQQVQVLTDLQHGEIQFNDVSASQFFAFLLQNTKEGYFADPIHGGNKGMASWKMIGFPGARASFKTWVNYPNATYPLGPVSIQGERG